MKSKIDKIAIVCLDDALADDVAKVLSQNLGMMFCCARDLLEYELSDQESFAKLTSEEYLLQSEQRVFRQIASFCDVVISLSYDNFVQGFHLMKQNCILVFLKVKKQQVTNKINQIMFSARTKELADSADVEILVKNENLQKTCDKIVDKLSKML